MEFITGLVTFSAEGKPPEWIKVAPRGHFTARDGRAFDVSPESLIERFNADGLLIPVDINHSTVKKAATGDETPVCGWIEELQARSDGLYGRVNWLDRGKDVLADKSHRYISPTFGKLDENRRAGWLHSVSLVATPAISMPALASSEPNSKETGTMSTAKYAEALGLSINATAEEIATEMALLKVRANGTEALIAGLGGVVKTLSSEVVTARSKRVDQRIDQAIAMGAVTPALRDFCVTIANADEGLFEEFCAKMGTPLAYLQKPMITVEQEVRVFEQERERPITLSSDAQQLAAQLGIDVKVLL